MKTHSSLYAAAALVLAANALALIHAARNRSGPLTAEVTLTDRQLSHYQDKDDSGVLLRLKCTNALPIHDRAKIRALGFDTAVPSHRQRARTAFVAFQPTPDGLTPIDATLQAPSASREGVLILPATIRLHAYPYPSPGPLSVSILDVPREIHVPLPFSDSFRNRHPDRYQVTLRYGQFHEPQITTIQIP